MEQLKVLVKEKYVNELTIEEAYDQGGRQIKIFELLFKNKINLKDKNSKKTK